MKRASKFLIPSNWQVLLSDLGVDLAQALAYAGLPPGLFQQSKVYLSPAQYFQFWHGIEAASGTTELPLKLAEVMSLESFDVPIFAAVCSPNFNAALKRLQQYKPLIGPMSLDVQQSSSATKAIMTCYGYEDALPKCFSLAELVFFTQLLRLATRKNINAMAVTVPDLPASLAEYENYFGCSLQKGENTSITFSANDAAMSFLTSNQSMLGFFEGELQQKLKEVIAESTITDRVSSVLLKTLPQGESRIEFVADQLALSKRSLQRKLADEQQSYQLVLQQVRQDLAEHYLTQTSLPIIEISFLLGFAETNSFVRAYSSWTGSTPTQTRSSAAH